MARSPTARSSNFASIVLVAGDLSQHVRMDGGLDVLISGTFHIPLRGLGSAVRPPLSACDLSKATKSRPDLAACSSLLQFFGAP
jgi:hypothetical protein